MLLCKDNPNNRHCKNSLLNFILNFNSETFFLLFVGKLFDKISQHYNCFCIISEWILEILMLLV